MKYISTAETAKRWGLSERTVRHQCSTGRIPGAVLKGKIWYVPDNARRPERINKRMTEPASLLDLLQAEKKAELRGGIYHRIQIDLTYNSNHMEGSRLTHDQTRYIYETNTIGTEGGAVRVDDVVETANHFRCVDMVIDQASRKLTESFIKALHRTLKNGTSDAGKSWFAVGEYKKLPNEVGGKDTTAPKDVSRALRSLLQEYNGKPDKSFEEILAFHYEFETIHPFQDGNGRVGRLILFKECLRNNIVPFIIDDDMKYYYYRGLAVWKSEPGYLTDTCLAAQDKFKKLLDYFHIPYEDNK